MSQIYIIRQATVIKDIRLEVGDNMAQGFASGAHQCRGRGRSGSVEECLTRPKGRRFKPHRRHCVVVLEQDTFILA